MGNILHDHLLLETLTVLRRAKQFQHIPTTTLNHLDAHTLDTLSQMTSTKLAAPFKFFAIKKDDSSAVFWMRRGNKAPPLILCWLDTIQDCLTGCFCLSFPCRATESTTAPSISLLFASWFLDWMSVVVLSWNPEMTIRGMFPTKNTDSAMMCYVLS